jgi:4'-phosphopantetheinyl transferase
MPGLTQAPGSVSQGDAYMTVGESRRMAEARISRTNSTAGRLFAFDVCSDTNILSEGEIHVWQLDLRNGEWDGFSSVLSRDEHEKTNRFRYARLRENFSRMRIGVRLILSRYLDASADRIQFSYTEAGKPSMAGSRVFFNVSHSNDIGLIAVALCPVGVDVELITDLKSEGTGIVAMVCHETERTELDMLSTVERCRLFYQLWTRKEAFCKAVGIGLQYAIADLFFQKQGLPLLYQVCDTRYGRLPYYVHDLACPLGYAGSVCAPFRPAAIRLFDGSLRAGSEDGSANLKEGGNF